MAQVGGWMTKQHSPRPGKQMAAIGYGTAATIAGAVNPRWIASTA
jgi:hypothetical protein